MKFPEYCRLNGCKILASFMCFLSYMSLGAAMTLLGSSLLDLQIQIDESFSTISHLIQVRSAGYIIGGIIAGFLDTISNRDLTLSLANFSTGVFLIIAPWLHRFMGLAIFILLSGISLGIVDIYCNVYIAQLWQQDSTNYFQILYMFYGIGALLAPLITRPFLLSIEKDGLNYSLTDNSTWTQDFSRNDVQIQYPYLIIGSVFILVSVSFCLCYFAGLQSGNNLTEETKQAKRMQFSRLKRYSAVVMTALIANFVFGGQNVVGSLGPAFAVKSQVNMSKRSATLLVTVFWLMFSFYRLIFIPLSMFFSEKRLLAVNLMIIVTSVILMVPRAAYNHIFTWTSFTLLGMGFSPCFAISYGLLQKHFTVSARMTSLIFLSGCFGESIHPWIVAQFMETQPEVYVYYLGFIGIICVILCSCLPVFCRKVFPKYDENESKARVYLDSVAFIGISSKD